MSGRGSFKGLGRSAIVALGKVGAWYRMAESSPVAGEWQTITDTLGGLPLVQTDSDRKLASGSSANGLPIGIYDGTDVMRMPLGANNFNVNKYGVALWIKHVSSDGEIFVIYNNDAALRVMDLYWYGNGKLDWTIYTDNATGRTYSTAVGAATTGAFNFVRIQWDSSKTNECDTTGSDTDAKARLFVGETAKALTASNFGVGAIPSTLRSPIGSAIFGALNDSDTPSTPLGNGTIHGPNTYILLATLTAAEGVILRDFEVPT